MMNTYKVIGLFLTAKINSFFTVSFDWLRFKWFACKIGTKTRVKCTIKKYAKVVYSSRNKKSAQKIFSYIYVLVIEVPITYLQMH